MGGGGAPPPPPPPPTPPTAPTPADTSVVDAGTQARALSAKGGIGSTIATGGGGLLGSAETSKKSLLGS